MEKWDFAGYATRNDIRCSDGRVIRKNAFADCDGMKVPLVYQHDHANVNNVLGHALLQNRPDGVYCFGSFNDTEAGRDAKSQVQHGDITALSIYANKLKQRGHDVLHGAIREVSLVLAGANPGAYIETVMAHDDDETEEAIIYFNEPLELSHADDVTTKKEGSVVRKKEGSVATTHPNAQPQNDDSEKTVQDIIDSMTEEQRNVLYALVGMAAEDEDDDSDQIDEGDGNMKHNVFENDEDYMAHMARRNEDFAEILRDMKRYGSLKESALQHGYEDITVDDALAHAELNYGVKQIGDLFPDYQSVTNVPGFVARDMQWVKTVMTGVAHTPFSRVKSVFANITADEARAKGYIKGNQKKEEVFPLLKRTTDPQTIYKKQKLDRDDLIDITSFDVVAWLKTEMRLMLDEEIARAILVGDGRSAAAEEKIQEAHVRPIWTDDSFYTINVKLQIETNASEDDVAKQFIRGAIKARKDYKGSGNPTLFTSTDMLNDMLLLTDSTGCDLYPSKEDLAKKLRVTDIVEVPVMENLTRKTGDGTNEKTYTLRGIIVNLSDYNVGADKGGSVNMFDDFDIDYNQMKYLIETRISGALIKPYSAIAVESTPKA